MSKFATLNGHQPPAPIGEDIASRWMLDPSITFLNHGSFGARLRSVVEAQRRRRDELEARPVEYLDRRARELITESMMAVGTFLGMAPGSAPAPGSGGGNCAGSGAGSFGFTTNATDGVNAVLRSLEFEPGDQLVTTNHVYNAVRQTLRFLTERAGAELIVAEVPLPVGSADDVVEAIRGALTERTRLVIVDQITSPSAIVFPIERIIELCAERGVDVLVDAAHGPGMLELDVESLGAAYYVGNLHKWVCAPPGAGFLWVREDKQDGIHPTVISHFFGEGIVQEFGWQGTRDITAWLTVPDAIREVGALGARCAEDAGWEGDPISGGWSAVRRHNHEMAVWVQAMLCEAWGVEPISPMDGSMLGSMASVFLPPEVKRGFESAREFQLALYDGYGIEIPVIDELGPWIIRSSCQVYNSPEQYVYLADSVKELIGACR